MLSEFLAELRARLLTTTTLSQETTQNGETLLNNLFQASLVDDTPAFVLANDFTRFINLGEVETNNADAAVLVEGDDALVLNLPTGSIDANNGPDALATGVQVEGQDANILNLGEIDGEFNGVQFAGAESSGTLTNFATGTISSDSRAVDIQGEGVTVNNSGQILGAGDQRNGTIYTNSTAEDVTINNFAGGSIDAGVGNNGAGISFQVGDEAGDEVSNTVFNAEGSEIIGRGQEASNTPGAGDGIRINNGADGTVSETDIVNAGLIFSESNQGTTAGIRVADGVSAEGRILNTETGTIDGVRNGLYIGEAEHDLDVLNLGTIQSGSRAVNIDGSGVDLTNAGDILGTGDQRNGTVYADGTADEFSVSNLSSGVIDAGEGNQGSGFAAEIGGAEDGANTFDLSNDGTIQGRGNGGAGTGLAGDGVRIGNAGNSGTFEGSITNTGDILSEGANGTVAGLRVVNNVNFSGTLDNSGTIAGTQNGLYFGTGDHSGSSVLNTGTISSDSRALNIDGAGLNIVNEGEILGTGDQRNGTVYADGTADAYSFTNTGTVDAGEGNNGSAVSLQTGDENGDVVSAFISNSGEFIGRGDATEGNTVGDGLRLFSNVEEATFTGLIQNEGVIAGSEDSDAAAGIRVDGGLDVTAPILNDGVISGNVNAIDASEGGSLTFINGAEGEVDGNVLLGDDDDFLLNLGEIDGDIDAGAGNDFVLAGDGDTIITGGLGSDFIDGGDGFDTADYSDLDVAITVDLDENGNGTVTRDTGFTITTDPVVIPDGPGASVQGTNVTDAASFLSEALAGNFYFNIHTSEFIGGEIRGQLDTIASDETVDGIRTIVLTGELDAAQEVGTGSDSEATGTGTLTITLDTVTGELSYTSEVMTLGLNEADLQTPAPGVASAIHLHNAPAGQNGAIVRDTFVDAGAVVDGNEPTGAAGDVLENLIETDTLTSIEEVVGAEILNAEPPVEVAPLAEALGLAEPEEELESDEIVNIFDDLDDEDEEDDGDDEEVEVDGDDFEEEDGDDEAEFALEAQSLDFVDIEEFDLDAPATPDVDVAEDEEPFPGDDVEFEIDAAVFDVTDAELGADIPTAMTDFADDFAADTGAAQQDEMPSSFLQDRGFDFDEGPAAQQQVTEDLLG